MKVKNIDDQSTKHLNQENEVFEKEKKNVLPLECNAHNNFIEFSFTNSKQARYEK